MQGSVMDFDQLMAIAAALNVTDPYIVLNHDSVNVLGRYADPAWGYNSLKAAAVAWLKYIVSKQYSVSCLLQSLVIPSHSARVLSGELPSVYSSAQVRHFVHGI